MHDVDDTYARSGVSSPARAEAVRCEPTADQETSVLSASGGSPADAPAHGPLALDADAFERLVIDELDRLPDDMIDGLDNVVFVVEDRPEDGSLDLLGLYDGWALTERDRYGVGELPDRIIVYREPHLAACADEDELRDEIHTTLVHEIAHFYGIDDERLHELGWA
ncbi:putative Zn-dependent protease with MMP-like domain [Microbacterium proteolyticum]|nr:putative Zn-dependent protease with MMP-like domain [Microbacterium sp. SORGH_AS_0344]MDQ1170677.1 putative Zn-dependent protease with MMP-like domain [Microbacterium proteolyticum]